MLITLESYDKSFPWVKDGAVDRERMLREVGEEARVPCESEGKSSRLSLREVFQAWDDHLPLYVKDWHAFAQVNGRCPLQEDDWLNPYTRAQKLDDFEFLYCGLVGTETALHCDVRGTSSTSWSLVGWKLWTFLPESWFGTLTELDRWSVSTRDGMVHLSRRDKNAPEHSWPDLRPLWKALAAEDKVWHEWTDGVKVLLQAPMTKITVPSLQPHLVYNLGSSSPVQGPDLVLSINHNSIKNDNVLKVLEALEQETSAVHRELWHLKEAMDRDEWLDETEKVLKANSGWNWADLEHFLHWVVLESGDNDNDNAVTALALCQARRQATTTFTT